MHHDTNIIDKLYELNILNLPEYEDISWIPNNLGIFHFLVFLYQ